jgi:FkbM family methyltransferase
VSPGALIGRQRIGHRLGALRGAAAAVTDPGRFVLQEIAALPLRPVAFALARVRRVGPGEAWATLTGPLGGLVAAHTLRESGRPVYLRRGTPDVFTLHETHTGGSYDPPSGAAAALAALGRPPRVLDLGANIGLFALHALARWPGARVTSFEPDPGNLAVLRRNAEANADAAWEVVPAAATTANGTVAFMTGHFAVSRAGEHGVRVPAHDVLPALSACDLLKIDIEGGEWPILADPRFRDTTAAVVVMEFHPWGAPPGDPATAARAALEGAGFTVGPVRDEEPGSGTLWAWRTT